MCDGDDESKKEKKTKFKCSEKRTYKEHVFLDDDDDDDNVSDDYRCDSPEQKSKQIRPPPSQLTSICDEDLVQKKYNDLRTTVVNQNPTKMQRLCSQTKYEPLSAPPKSCTVCGPPPSAWMKKVGSRHIQMAKTWSPALALWTATGVGTLLYTILFLSPVEGCRRKDY